MDTKRIKYWFLVFFVGAVVVLAPILTTYNAYAVKQISIENAREKLEEAAMIQVIAHKLSKCLPSVNIFGISGSSAQVGKIFTGTTNIATGYWLENKIQNKVDDAEIWCKNDQSGKNILQLFAGALKLDVKDVICNKYTTGGGKGGLLARFYNTYSTGGYEEVVIDDVDCNRFEDTSRSYILNPASDGGEAYLQKLYEEYDNKYLVPWSSIGTYEQANGYFMYLKDFKTYCGSEIVPTNEKEHSSHFSVPVKTLNDDGEIIEQWYRPASGKSDSSVLHNSFVEAGKGLSCKQTIDKINSYVSYFQTAIHDAIKTNCEVALKPEISNAIAELQAILDSENESEERKAQASENLEILKDAQSGGKYTVSTAAGGLQCNNDLPTVPSVVQAPPTNPDDDGGNEKNCFDGGKALGWILCPLLDGLSDMVGNIYTDIVEPFLAIDAKLISGAEDNGTYRAWQLFQSVANIVFVILLLVVIFSQLTGVGIDNYGIKKILPKLIIAAILINLSYIICQLLVDVSNILGYGLKGFFDGIVESLNTVTISIESAGEKITLEDPVSTGATIFTSMAGIFAITGIAGVILAQGWAIILPALLALLSAAIALIFTFILLGVRQAGVVILVAISPLAFVAYMLPNTKPLFDRWLKMFQGLLLLFPICGLLIGGGSLASRIILDAGTTSFWVALVAMLLNIVPFFFIPTLLKGSFAAMGNIGAKISGISKGARKMATGKIEGSERYQDTRAKWAAGKDGGLRQRIATGMNKDGTVNTTRRGRFAAKLAGATGARDAMAKNRAAYLKRQRDEGMVDSMLGSGYAAASARLQSDLSREALENEIALMKGPEDQGGTNNYDTDTMSTQLSRLLANNLEDGSEGMLRAKALMKKLSTSGGYGQKQLAKIVSGDQVSAQNRQFVAGNMMKDADVAAAINKKDAAAAQYLREVNSGETETSMNLDTWKSTMRGNTGMTNMVFVASEVASDDIDFASQSTGAVKEMLGAPGIIDDDRLQRIIDNKQLMNSADGEVIKAITEAAKSRGLQATELKQQAASLAAQQSQAVATEEILRIQRSRPVATEPVQPQTQTPSTQGSTPNTRTGQDTVIRTGPDAGRRQTPGGIIY